MLIKLAAQFGNCARNQYSIFFLALPAFQFISGIYHVSDRVLEASSCFEGGRFRHQTACRQMVSIDVVMAGGSENIISSGLRFLHDHVTLENSTGIMAAKEMLQQVNWHVDGTLPLTVLALLLGAWILQWKLWRGSKSSSNERPFPPGSLGLPFLGETLSFLSALQANKPETFFLSRAAKYGKVFKSSIVGCPIVSVDAPFGNKFMFSNDGKLLGNFYPKSVTEICGTESFAFRPHEEHRRLKRIIMTYLGGETLKSFAPKMEATVVAHLAEFWEGKEQVMAASSLKHFAFQVACDLFLSLKDGPELKKLEQEYGVLIHGMMNLPINLPGFRYHKALAARTSVLSFLDGCINRRREELRQGHALPNQDLLSVFLTVADEDGKFMADDVIKDNILFVVAGGYETSSNTMAIALKYLAENPSILEQVLKEQLDISAQKGDDGLTWKDLKEMKYTWHVLQETIRLQPQVQAAFREAVDDVEYEGYTIPKGWKMIWSAHRSHKVPEFFPDPEKFDPSRFEGSGPQPYTYLPFGSGTHTCPGIEYAKMEMLLYLHHVVTRFQWSPLYPQEQISINPSPAPKWGLPLKISTRASAN